MCGIFGQVSIKPKRFDYTAFCTLGIHNDVRGGDSCGVFIDGNVEYGVGQKKLFEDFFETSDLVQKTKTSQIAFGHCRKASVGAINETTAQPVIIRNKENKIEFVVVHNGTIYNYKELAKKYIPEININNLTDSQVMTRIFYYKGYDVLNEYNGGAVFAIADYRKENPEILFWRGESPNSINGKAVEERPLYVAIDKDELLFSSIYTFLPVLRRNAEVAQLSANMLIRYNGVDLEIVKEYSRQGQYQYNRSNVNDDTYYYGSGYYNNYYGHNSPVTIYSGSGASSSHIYCSTKDGKCFKGGVPIQGMVKCDIYGNVSSNSTVTYEMWFWNGTLLKNKKCYDYLSVLAQNFGCSPQDVDDIYKELVLFFSPYPYIRTKEGLIEIVDSPVSSKLYTGSFYFPFNALEINVVNGKHVSQIVKCISVGMQSYIKSQNDPVPYDILCNNFGMFTDESY